MASRTPPAAPRDAIRDHLEYFGELGVDGVRLEPEWRTRLDRGVRLQADSTRGEADSSPADHLRQGYDGLHIPLTEVDPLNALRIDIGPDCSRCKLHTLGRRQVVFGVGNPNADLMFVGEAPGADEDIQGEPFVGRAGQLLTKIIEAIDLKREDVYIANVIKCRPPGIRNPEPVEVDQ